MRLIALLLMLSAQPAFAADQFDLVCSAKKSQVRYRVDLAAGEWCAGDCSRTFKLAEVTSGMLVLERTVRQTPRGPQSTIEINRQSGAWHTYSFDPTLDIVPFVRDGTCSPEAFSGLGTQQRKF